MLDRKAFNFYKSFYDVALLLPENDKIEFLMAICHSQFTGEIVEPKGQLAKLAFTSQLHSIKKQIDGYNHGKNTPPLKTPLKGRRKAPLSQVQEKEEEEVKEKEKEKQTKEEFVSLEFLDSYSLWLEYKKQRKESYANELSRKAFYNKLLKLSNNNPTIAIQIVNQSIENNWSGIFELKNSGKQLSRFNNTKGTIHDNNF